MLFDDHTISRVRENIFPGAHNSISDWHNFPWHTGPRGDCDSDLSHSSQALAVDVFGTLQMSAQRDAILNALASRLGLPAGHDWRIELEYLDNTNLLKELRLTQVDAAAFSSTSLIFFECKFTETDGGSCRQPLALSSGAHKGCVQCSGKYVLQTNPVNQKEARCALTGKGIRYWEYIPKVFQIQNDVDQAPCPFRDSWYQWMRNLTNCYALAEASGRKPAFVVVYADSPALPMPQLIQSARWQDLTGLVRQENILFKTLSYQKLIEIAGQSDPTSAPVWEALQEWVTGKIERACARQ